MICRWRGKAIMAVLIIAVLMLSGISPALAVSQDVIQTATDKAINYYQQKESCDDWEWLGLRWLDTKMAPTLISSAAAIPSDYARQLLGKMAAGESSAAINASIAALQGFQQAGGNFNSGDATSLNQTIWPVIALNCAAVNGYAADYAKDNAAAYIAAQQDVSGGFDESGWGVDVDSTAHALIALAPYKNAAGYSAKIDQALAYLKSQQAASGGFESWGSVSPDSTAAVIEALVALDYDPQAPGDGWKGNMVEALLGFQLENGAFYISSAPGTANTMTTRNALLALGDLVQAQSKYLNQWSDGLILMVTKNKTPRLDSDAGITVKVSNGSNDSKEFLLIVALYNKSLEKMNVYNAVSQSINGKSELETNYGLSLPSSGTYELRVYVWDNWTNRTPLARPIVIPLQ